MCSTRVTAGGYMVVMVNTQFTRVSLIEDASFQRCLLSPFLFFFFLSSLSRRGRCATGHVTASQMAEQSARHTNVHFRRPAGFNWDGPMLSVSRRIQGLNCRCLWAGDFVVLSSSSCAILPTNQPSSSPSAPSKSGPSLLASIELHLDMCLRKTEDRYSSRLSS